MCMTTIVWKAASQWRSPVRGVYMWKTTHSAREEHQRNFAGIGNHSTQADV